MATFSERMGLREPRTLIQSTDLDDDTRTALWNVLDLLRDLLTDASHRYTSSFGRGQEIEAAVLTTYWTQHLRQPRDEMPRAHAVWDSMKKHIRGGEWNEALDVIEVVARVLARQDSHNYEEHAPGFTEAVNDRFETYMVGYRFIGNEITPIDSNAQADAVVDALSDAAVVPGALHSLERAIELLSSRESPDYPNSIKEAISAIEAITKSVTGKTTLSDGLKKLESNGLTIHPALKEGWLKLYGWTSDESGVRHGGITAADVDQTLAKYMLVSSSAFISYLVEEGRKAQLL